MKRELKFRIWDKKEKEYFSPVDRPKDNPTCTQFSIFHDENFVVEQFSGLKDKNGVEIFEGDILSLFGGKCLVDYFNGRYVAGCYKLHKCYKLSKVIGNIHENPALLCFAPI